MLNQTRRTESLPGSSIDKPADLALYNGQALLSAFDFAPEFVKSDGQIWRISDSVNTESSAGGITYNYEKVSK